MENNKLNENEKVCIIFVTLIFFSLVPLNDSNGIHTHISHEPNCSGIGIDSRFPYLSTLGFTDHSLEAK